MLCHNFSSFILGLIIYFFFSYYVTIYIFLFILYLIPFFILRSDWLCGGLLYDVCCAHRHAVRAAGAVVFGYVHT